MSRSMVVRWFLASLIGLAGGVIFLVVSGGLALATMRATMQPGREPGSRPESP